MSTWKQLKATLHRDPAFVAEWHRFAPERQIALYLVRLRMSHGWSQRELAKRLGLKQSEVSRIESGERNLSLKTVQRIAEATHTKLVLQFNST